MRQTIIISVDKQPPIDNGPIDGLFDLSRCISEAAGKFWDMKLAKSCYLETAERTATGYDVTFSYKGGDQ